MPEDTTTPDEPVQRRRRAPEVGQALAKQAAEERAKKEQAKTKGKGKVKPADTPVDPVSSDAPDTPAVNDGTVSLEELPDSDIFALAKAQKIKLPKDPNREQAIQALNAEGISRVLAPPTK